jgi:hypothetical protein
MANKFRSDRERDPIAELARLIDQSDSYGESAAADNGFHHETASQRHDELPGFPRAPQLSAELNAPEQAHELYGYGHDSRAYYVDDQAYVADKEYQTEVPHVRQRSLALVMAIIGLALVGTAGAFGYRAMFGGSVLPTPPPIITASNEPNKIARSSNEPQAENSANARQVDVITTGSIEKLVSREEQPATIEPPKAAPRSSSRVGAPPIAGRPVPDQAMPHAVVATDAPGPPPNAVASQHADHSGVSGGTAAANRAHSATAAVSTAESARPVIAGGYAVQVTSEQSESAAQAAFQMLKAKYPSQLGGRRAIIRRADLGAAGTYYRALVGPVTSAEQARRLCSRLKAAGADCIIQKN